MMSMAMIEEEQKNKMVASSVVEELPPHDPGVRRLRV